MEFSNVKEEISRFSIDKLISVFGRHPGDAYMPGCIVTDRNNQEKNGKQFPMNYPFAMNALVMILCEKGGFTVETNMDCCHVGPHCLYVNLPGQIMQVSEVVESRVRIIAFDVEFGRRLNLDVRPVIDQFVNLRVTQQCLPLSDTAFLEMMTLGGALSEEIRNNPKDDMTNEIVRNIVQTMLLKLARVVSAQTEKPDANDQKDKSTGYFKEFMRLLGENYKQERSVTFYANKLCLSSKYLTTLIKRTSGNSATWWISHFVILEAKNQLKYSSKNVQEIAYSLNFPNQSFFGKFFKQHTGMTPCEYRRSR